MQKSPYRNAVRSKRLIREAFIELIATKSIDKITVGEITEKADLSRNTFYCHYQDIYAVLEELQAETMQQLKDALDKGVAEHSILNPEPFLQKVAAVVEQNRENYAILLRAKGSDAFVNQIAQTMLQYVIEGLDTEQIKEPKRYLVFLEIISYGFISLFQQYLLEDIDVTPADIVRETNCLYMSGIELYK